MMISIIRLTTILVLMVMPSITVEDTVAQDSYNKTDCGNSKMPFNKSTIMEAKPWGCTLRLSPHVHPSQYVLYISLIIKNNSFSGYVEITITLETPQSFIKLHSNNLDITETTLDSKSVTAFSYPKYQFWVVVPDNELCAGTYKLRIQFNGHLSNTMMGFYRSVYTNIDSDEQRYIATTQFEPTYARSAFPCFDEPLMKSKFKISITRPSDNNFIALSNMNQECEEVISPTNGLTVVHFANTVPMSTYLICFIVCDFQSIEPVKTDQGFSIRAFARRGQQQNLKYARFVALNSINYYVEYFGIKYPLPKLDLISIPDFAEGAMENWGLVTFREEDIEYDECTSSSYNKEQVAVTVSHELAHMWFGDLVTMKWWNDLWLNEGFATYMAVKALQVVQPDWDYDTMLLINILHDVMGLDDKISSHPIVQEVSDPDEIDSIFDSISYNKGSSILRMLEETLGKDVFRTGIISYLKKHQFNNAQTDDLWYELQIASQNIVDVRKVMDTWTRQTGFPVVSATRDGTKLTLKQHRFLTDPNAIYSVDSSPFKYKWEIPLTYITSENSAIAHKIWLCSNQDSVTIDRTNIEWIKINYRQIGYYIVNYSNDDWCLLSNLLKKNINALSAADRANLLYDSFSLAEATYISYEIPLTMAKYLISEYHYVPWNVAFIKLQTLWYKLVDRPVGPQYKCYLQHLLRGVNEDLWNDSISRTYLERRNRELMIHIGGLCDVPIYKKKIYEIFKKFLDQKIPINVDIKYFVYCYGIASGNTDDWNKVWDLYLKEQDPHLRLKFLGALTYTKDSSLLSTLIQYSKNEKYIRSQDFFSFLYDICQNVLGPPLVWNFIRNEWEYLVKRFTLDDVGLGNIIVNTCAYFQTQERLDEMKAFYKKYPDAGAGKLDRTTAMETVVNNIKWLEHNEAFITNWMKNNN
ncbi:ERAP1-like C-terminal domain,Aminopeptidase N-type,Peptidase M1, membrane alanine aminopeptidase, N- [Cinara cedri]|uniref:Aminopeptidase n=1 Tax=Cinara cedri TaxID=506608 RepID=A0A5E4MUF8_9HEMI|nr:ERAP1-like C-terminal domain,Aminopeptidase N-type,Peptidase M1, membrane alanine aminopeptidase, N- [Cinara cedri]